MIRPSGVSDPREVELFVTTRLQKFMQHVKIVIPSEAEGLFSSGHGFSRAVRRREETGF
jgi:hypothetical protein